jgi:hypothetical protein
MFPRFCGAHPLAPNRKPIYMAKELQMMKVRGIREEDKGKVPVRLG